MFSLLPRPSFVANAVVAVSVVSGLAFGVVAGGLIVAASMMRRA